MFNCAECCKPLGEGTRTDPYAHTVACLHLNPGPLESLEDQVRLTDAEHQRRVLQNLAGIRAEQGGRSSPEGLGSVPPDGVGNGGGE